MQCAHAPAQPRPHPDPKPTITLQVRANLHTIIIDHRIQQGTLTASGRQQLIAKRRWQDRAPRSDSGCTGATALQIRALGLWEACPALLYPHSTPLRAACLLSAVQMVASGWRDLTAEMALRRLPALAECSDREMSALIEHSQVVSLRRYTVLYRKNAPSTSFYVLLRGSMRATTCGAVSGTRDIAKNGLLGCSAWLVGTLHTHQATAREACVVLRVNAAEVRHDTRLVALSAALARELEPMWYADVLRHDTTLHLSQGWEAKSVEELAGLVCHRVIRSGELVIREGDTSEEMFILVTGEVTIFRQAVAKVSVSAQTIALERINEANDSTLFGDIGLYYSHPRTASVRAVEMGLLLVLPRKHFEAYLQIAPDTSGRIRAKVTLSHARHMAAGITRVDTNEQVSDREQRAAEGEPNKPHAPPSRPHVSPLVCPSGCPFGWHSPPSRSHRFALSDGIRAMCVRARVWHEPSRLLIAASDCHRDMWGCVSV